MNIRGIANAIQEITGREHTLQKLQVTLVIRTTILTAVRQASPNELLLRLINNATIIPNTTDCCVQRKEGRIKRHAQSITKNNRLS